MSLGAQKPSIMPDFIAVRVSFLDFEAIGSFSQVFSVSAWAPMTLPELLILLPLVRFSSILRPLLGLHSLLCFDMGAQNPSRMLGFIGVYVIFMDFEAMCGFKQFS